MARVTVEDCVTRVPNRFELVVLAAQRVREIVAGAVLTVDRDRDRNPVVALREIAELTVDLNDLRDGKVRSLQKHVKLEEPEEDILELVDEQKEAEASKTISDEKATEELPSTEASEAISDEKATEELPSTEASEAISDEKATEELPSTEASEAISDEKATEELPSTDEGSVGLASLEEGYVSSEAVEAEEKGTTEEIKVEIKVETETDTETETLIKEMEDEALPDIKEKDIFDQDKA